jgi:hypothetical protein
MSPFAGAFQDNATSESMAAAAMCGAGRRADLLVRVGDEDQSSNGRPPRSAAIAASA